MRTEQIADTIEQVNEIAAGYEPRAVAGLVIIAGIVIVAFLIR